MWDLNGKKHTCAWTFENSSGRATWLVHSWLTPRWGLCPSFLVVATTLQQFPLALAVTTTSNSTTFLPLPTESYHATSSVVTLDVLVGLCGGGGQTLCPCWGLPFFFLMLLSGCLSLDHFFHSVDCEAAGILGSTPPKQQVRGRNVWWPLGWGGDHWCIIAWNVSEIVASQWVLLPEASPCLEPNIWCLSISRDAWYNCLNELDACNPWLALDWEQMWQWLATLGQLLVQGKMDMIW